MRLYGASSGRARALPDAHDHPRDGLVAVVRLLHRTSRPTRRTTSAQAPGSSTRARSPRSPRTTRPGSSIPSPGARRRWTPTSSTRTGTRSRWTTTTRPRASPAARRSRGRRGTSELGLACPRICAGVGRPRFGGAGTLLHLARIVAASCGRVSRSAIAAAVTVPLALRHCTRSRCSRGAWSRRSAPATSSSSDTISPLDARVGDVVTFRDPEDPTRLSSHRVISMHVAPDGVAFVTKGDANTGVERWSDRRATARSAGPSTASPSSATSRTGSAAASAGLAFLVVPALLLGARSELGRIWRPGRQEDQAMKHRRRHLRWALLALTRHRARRRAAGGIHAAFSNTTSNPSSSFNAQRIFAAHRRRSRRGTCATPQAAPARRTRRTPSRTRTPACTRAARFGTTANTSKYFEFNFNSPLPPGSAVSSASFTFTFASHSAAGDPCYYLEARRASNNTLLATYGSSGSPIACMSGTRRSRRRRRSRSSRRRPTRTTCASA